ncbi:malate dehydrogenase [Metarhizium album ARSEF 1941]|uniref:Malate dehydrogenase n=1 Tax=Metarhizium album (strain ARSEF 1941) TaxID=1081103 RepID=A0A0B2WLK3_METAS|nr:malate dehydrogenase [Metarhizium album ARSEF 1941]KHN93900.1 malate dehydrogenase [Metarhizium album ARSEF 1941]
MYKAYLLLLSAALAAALPGSCSRVGSSKSADLPQTGEGKNLPQPPRGSRLLHIALGIGVQNYTCASVGASAVATGALAMLYDITNLFPGQGNASLSQEDWDSLTSRALRSQNVPLNFDTSLGGRVKPDSPGASRTDPFPNDGPLSLECPDDALPFLGHHFFNSAGVPVFSLSGGEVNLLAEKLASVDAPATADRGPDGTGAVAWLQLGAIEGTVGDVKLVYRVLTAGGNSHGCQNAAGEDSTKYAAQYWFFA